MNVNMARILMVIARRWAAWARPRLGPDRNESHLCAHHSLPGDPLALNPVESLDRIEAGDLTTLLALDPSFELTERFAAAGSKLRALTLNDLIDKSPELNEMPTVEPICSDDGRPRPRMPFVGRGPVPGGSPTQESRNELTASIDATILAELHRLHLASRHAPDLDTAVHRAFRCWRRLRAVSETGLFMHRYYAYQTQISGSPFSILMHYLNEIPEVAAQPNPLFNTNYYLLSNKGARHSLHPFIEYTQLRRRRGATTHWSFSDVEYAKYAGVEVKDAMAHCIDHYAAYARSNATSAIVSAYAASDTRSIESFIFDPAFYGWYYGDMATASLDERVTHYLSDGVSERRFGSIGERLLDLGQDNFFVPVDFDPIEYGELNPDLEFRDDRRSLLMLEHFIANGLREGRHYTRDSFNAARPIARRPDEASHGVHVERPVGIFVHMFYTDMWPAISSYLQNMRGVKHSLFINLVTSTFDPDVFSQIRLEFPEARILISPNEGRDIGGLFRLFAEVDFKELSAVAICHSKKSPHLAPGVGQTWMRDLMDAYAETSGVFAQSVYTIQQDPHVGIIASAKWRRVGVGEANDRCYKLISSLLPGLKGQIPEFPSGTMFLAKPAIIKGVYSALKELEFENGDGVDLKLQIDGQIAHAVERAFGHMARSLALDILWR
jgi:hypothetical protein